MYKEFIGRQLEQKQLKKYFSSNRAEFIAVYGRRRVGKTYLIQHFFNNQFTFSATGIIDGSSEEQLFSFTRSLIQAGHTGNNPSNWLEAFEILRTVLENVTTNGRKVIYIDELPSFDTPRSGFIRALGYFWNSWASGQKNIMLIVCGSATSWMINNLISDHGGLHNRITHTIYLRQFTLAETEEYLKAKCIHWPHHTIAETYMMLGGIPFYLSLLDSEESLAQNIDRLYFMQHGELTQEYHRLYSSLFKNPEGYTKIIDVLACSRQGMTRSEIIEALRLTSSKTLTQQLNDLVNCDIIRQYYTKVNGKRKTSNAYYQLMDFFTLFHLTFSKRISSESYWQQRVNSPLVNTWQGLAFEQVCMAHMPQIRHALGLDRIAVEYYSWRSHEDSKAQIDMIIERADRLINLCEIKYSQSEYIVTADEDRKMRNRAAAFLNESKSRCGIIPTWITTFGLKPTPYTAEIQYQITLAELFRRAEQ